MTLSDLENSILQQRATINHKLNMMDKYYNKTIEEREKVKKFQAEIIRFIQDGEYLH